MEPESVLLHRQGQIGGRLSVATLFINQLLEEEGGLSLEPITLGLQALPDIQTATGNGG